MMIGKIMEAIEKFDEGGWELVTAFATRGGIVGKGSQEQERIYYIFRRPKK